MGMSTVLFGEHPRTGQFFIDHGVDTIAACCGAIRGQDGWGSMNVSFGNLIRSTAEINESIYPHRQLARDYVTDSGGAGEYRGGCGTQYHKEMTAPCTLYTFMVGIEHPVPGIHGGYAGAPNQLTIRVGKGREQVITHLAPYVSHEAGEGFVYRYAGGGGWGDPLERDPDRVKEDVLDEYVSIERARQDYGVVLTGSVEDLDVEVDRPATAELRAEMRRSRA
jgi:N-methylhydantoinase B